MDESRASSSYLFVKGLTKSNSVTSKTGSVKSNPESVKSHESIPALGAHPLGTLRVIQPDDPPRMQSSRRFGEPESFSLPAAGSSSSAHVSRPSTLHAGNAWAAGSSPQPPDKRLHGLGGGDVVLILDVPERFMIGYDSLSFTATHFRGVKEIPPGPHFFWMTQPDCPAARSGFWVYSSGVDQLHVMQWDKFNEVVVEPGRAVAGFQLDSIASIYDTLLPYRDPARRSNGCNGSNGSGASPAPSPATKHEQWKSLVTGLSETVLDSIMGSDPRSWCIHTGDRVRGSPLMAREMELERAMTNSVFRNRELNFAFAQDATTIPPGLTGADRTDAATDSSRYLTSVVDSSSTGYQADTLIGEFQFAFIVGMYLGNHSCIQQWWYMLLQLILRAYNLPFARAVLAAESLQTVAAQLLHSSEYMDSSVVDYDYGHASDLRVAFTIYKRRLDDLLHSLGASATSDQLSVSAALSGIESSGRSLGWDLRADYVRSGKVMLEDGEEVELDMSEFEAEDERGEYAPVLVDTDEEGHQRDLVSFAD